MHGKSISKGKTTYIKKNSGFALQIPSTKQFIDQDRGLNEEEILIVFRQELDPHLWDLIFPFEMHKKSNLNYF